MLKILPIYCICTFMTWVSDRLSIFDMRKNLYRYREPVLYAFMSIIMSIFAGLRYSYNDTANYINSYVGMELSSKIDWGLGSYPGFVLFCRVLRHLRLSSSAFIMVTSLIIVGIHLWFIHKYSNNRMLAIFLFIAMGCLGLSMAAIKQTLAVSISLVGIDRLIRKKRVQFVVLILLATTFHPFALMFLICPLLYFRPWGKRTYIMLAVFILLGINLQTWLGNLIGFINLMGTDYDEQYLLGEGVNMFRLIVSWAPVLLSWITMKYWNREENHVQNLMINLMTLNAALMFVALFGNPVYFGRLANYFLVFQVIGLTWLIQYFELTSQKVVIVGLMLAYFGYFVYGNVLNGATFDQSYLAYSLEEFLGNIVVKG